ncbi:amidophosphoribosyltransferase [Flavipsychrobacter stenotrophus]|uniref:Amidophosphoribosyltransferase n=1 Tax=Flavipsychrobacter stenotrophus TaxID=2077091 RepID=A0A2S7SVR2_9BACT|nr:amidophosphoribosyltransferase [Flavipsychrobacter stenotrophus]PQJ11009.1 amidophosphoribosyltransferase [Flavipsychrobacter stenotrophus]
MSDAIQHECGLAYIRLLKPLSHYHVKYGTAVYGLNKLYLLMEKQHNRGQDGAGIASVKLDVAAGHQNMHRLRVSGQQAIGKIFQNINEEVGELEKMYPNILQHPGFLKGYMRFAGEILLGHLRYGTQGKNNIEFCHPFIKPHINPTRNLAMAGNFNLVNTDELFNMLDSHPTGTMRESDLGAMIETIHYYLCMADDTNPESLNIEGVLKQATTHFDGGYVFSGLIGNGDSFVMRDPNGIRPCYYYVSDEVVVAASERAAIMTAFNVTKEQVIKLAPGHAIIISADGTFKDVEILAPRQLTACSFERIYFSRGSDPEIYRERMQLGRNLADTVLKSLDYHLKHTIVSFIPNTAETAFYGLIKGLEDYLKDITLQRIYARKDNITEDEMRELVYRRVRIEKIAIKDAKLRTFITEDASRNEMVQHVYDITYGTVERGVDTLVIIDDSIVRGTTLKESIIKMLDRLGPKRIIVVSSAPQIRYPDCYGIDMSRMGDFIAFQAAVGLLADTGREHILTDAYNRCKEAEANGGLKEENFVKAVYEPFTAEEISNKIARMLKHKDVNTEVDVIYQSIEGLYNACPNDRGDWYFTGNYPTKGGNRVANKAFMNYMEQKEGRGY